MDLLFHSATQHEIDALLSQPAHAVGIFGQNGAGKTAVAEHIAREILQVAALEQAPNVHRIDATDGDGIAQIRGIRTFLSLKTAGTASIRRMVIIEQADHLGKDAQNALLKTLEEPPTDTMLVLTAAEKSHLLPTILSRIRTIRIMPLTKAQCLSLKGYDGAELEKAYNLSGGYPGLFMGLLESGSEHQMNHAVTIAKQFLGQKPYERLTHVETYSKDKEQGKLLVLGLQICLHAALRTAKPNSLPLLHKKLEYVGIAEQRLRHNVQSKLLLTTLATQL